MRKIKMTEKTFKRCCDSNVNLKKRAHVCCTSVVNTDCKYVWIWMPTNAMAVILKSCFANQKCSRLTKASAHITGKWNSNANPASVSITSASANLKLQYMQILKIVQCLLRIRRISTESERGSLKLCSLAIKIASITSTAHPPRSFPHRNASMPKTFVQIKAKPSQMNFHLNNKITTHLATKWLETKLI